MRALVAIKFFLHLTLAATPQYPLQSSQNYHGPSKACATSNANLIFNAIHSSMRQWGSSINHNGMSFFPAYIPEGTLLYHGTPSPKLPTGPKWLAFEISHAEMFCAGAFIRKTGPEVSAVRGRLGSDNTDDWEAVDLRSLPPDQRWALENGHHLGLEFVPGYFQVYQARRDLKVLYLDGMAAAKSQRGTSDAQDILLLNFTGGVFDERTRAKELCALGETLGVEGFIRMEGGFELIKCDFSEGLDLISSKRRPDADAPTAFNSMLLFNIVQDVASRYNGIGAGRVKLDYSSMISAFFYPANLSNPDEDQRQAKLPRLVNTDLKVVEQIKSDVRRIFNGSRPKTSANWQGVADMIVTRFAPRLKFLATSPPQGQFLSQVNNLLNTFIDFAVSEEQSLVEVCSMHYLQPIQSIQHFTGQDRLLEVAFTAVMYRICSTLFEVRNSLLEKQNKSNTGELVNAGDEAVLIEDLNAWLEWSDWVTCGHCAIDQVCFVAYFPWGSAEDHYSPRCQNSTELNDHLYRGDNYWGLNWHLAPIV